jgi:hypothetical protein
VLVHQSNVSIQEALVGEHFSAVNALFALDVGHVWAAVAL